MDHDHIKKLGQYFTTSPVLQKKLYSFIQNNPTLILEPSCGAGDLVKYIKTKKPTISFDLYEIDPKITPKKGIKKSDIHHCDFLEQKIETRYKTIIGNPPYVKTKTGNLYLKFIAQCVDLLDQNGGELIFIVPSDLFKISRARLLLKKMLDNGRFTHIFHPHDEKLFENANINVIVFRYENIKNDSNMVLYNDVLTPLNNSDGIINFGNITGTLIKNISNIYVGLVSGKDSVYKHEKLGNISLLSGNGVTHKFIYINKYPSKDDKIDKYLLGFKETLMTRGIKKFNKTNWFEWGAPRNMKTILENMDRDCIYIHNLTRKEIVAFRGKVQYFSGNLLMLLLKPDVDVDLDRVVNYLNSAVFRDQYMYSGRFKIGQKQLCNSYLDF